MTVSKTMIHELAMKWAAPDGARDIDETKLAAYVNEWPTARALRAEAERDAARAELADERSDHRRAEKDVTTLTAALEEARAKAVAEQASHEKTRTALALHRQGEPNATLRAQVATLRGVLEHAQFNVRALTGGDERRIAAALAETAPKDGET